MLHQTPSEKRTFCTLCQANNSNPMPSSKFTAKLLQLCGHAGQDDPHSNLNSYDAKNHVLHLNDLEGFTQQLKDRENRSFESFQKQLRMMGFRVRGFKNSVNSKQENGEDVQNQKLGGLNGQALQKDHSQNGSNKVQSASQPAEIEKIIQEPVHREKTVGDRISAEKNQSGLGGIGPSHEKKNSSDSQSVTSRKSQSDSPPKVVYFWKCNKIKTVEHQLQILEEELETQLEKALLLKEKASEQREALDQQFEKILFGSLLQEPFKLREQKQGASKKSSIQQECHSLLRRFMGSALQSMKSVCNESLLSNLALSEGIGSNLAKELEIYRILILKQCNAIRFEDERSKSQFR